MKETIGWIGIGSMGHRMSRHLAKAGYPLVVADAVSTKRAPPGATIAKSNAEVAEQADVIILSLPDGSCRRPSRARSRRTKKRRVKTVIDTSTIGIKAAEAVAAVLEQGRHPVRRRAGVGRHVGRRQGHDCHHGGLLAGAYERFKPLLALMGKPFHVGPKPGQGQAVKVLNNYLSATALAATLGGDRLRHQAGHRDEDHPRHRQRLVGPQLGDRGQVPQPHPARTLRRGLRGQASAQGHPPLSGERHALPASPTRWPRRGRRLAAHGGGDAGLRHHGDVPLHSEGRVRRKDAPDDAWRGRSARLAAGLPIAKRHILLLHVDKSGLACDRVMAGKNSSTLTGWRLGALRRAQGAGATGFMEVLAALRGSKLGLRTHLVIFGLAIVVPVLLYSAFLLHRYTQSVHASERTARAADRPRPQRRRRSRDRRPSSPRCETLATSRRTPPRGLPQLLRAGQGGAADRGPGTCVLIDAKRRQLVNTRLPLGYDPARRAIAAEPDLPRIARETGSPTCRICSWAPSPSAGSSP